MHRTIALFTTLALCPTPAFAEPTDAETKVAAAGLAFVAEEVKPKVPAAYNFGSYSQRLIDCPFTSNDTKLYASGIKASVTLDTLKIQPASGELRVTVKGRVAGTASTQVTRPYACLGSTLRCKATLQAADVSATATFKPAMVFGLVKLKDPQVTINATKATTSVKLGGCGVAGNLATLALNAFKRWWLKKASEAIEKVARDRLPPLIEPALSRYTSGKSSVGNYSLSGSVKHLLADSEGLRVGVDVALKRVQTASCNISAPPKRVGASSSPKFTFRSAHLGVAVDGAAIAEAIDTAWTSGAFCLTYARLQKLGISKALLASSASLLGFSRIDTISAELPKPPQLTLDKASGEMQAKLKLAGLNLKITAVAAGVPIGVTASFDADTKLKVVLDPLRRSLMLESAKPTFKKVSVNAPSVLPLTPTQLNTMMANMLGPLVQKALGKIEVVPEILHQKSGTLAPYYLYVTHTSSTNEYAQLYAKMHRKASSDSTAPSTSLTTEPDGVISPRLFRFSVTGRDNNTPTPLLRYAWRVDSSAWGKPKYAYRLTVPLTSGRHTVQVRAVDLHGNVDSTPAKASFTVDAVAPTLKLTKRPPATTSRPAATIGFVAKDDLSSSNQIVVRYRLEKLSSGASKPALVADKPLAAGATSLALTALSAARYRLVLVARDAAGNMSKPQQTTFTVTSPGFAGPAGASPAGGSSDTGEILGVGCGIAPRTATPPPWALLLLGMLLLSRRRR